MIDVIQCVVIVLLIVWNFHIVGAANKVNRFLAGRIIKLERRNRR